MEIRKFILVHCQIDHGCADQRRACVTFAWHLWIRVMSDSPLPIAIGKPPTLFFILSLVGVTTVFLLFRGTLISESTQGGNLAVDYR